MKNHLFLLCFFMCFLSLYGMAQREINVTVNRQVQPVFIGKNENPVLTVKVNNPTQEEITVKSITVSTQGTTDLSNIESVRVFFTGTDNTFRSQVLFGKTGKATDQLEFKGEQQLLPGDNYFWVAVHLSAKASLKNKIDINCSEVQIADVVAKIDYIGSAAPSSIGYAVRQRKDDGVDTYRIPGLVKTAKGTLIAAYDIRRASARDLQGDIDVGVSRSLDDGHTWLPMQKVMDMKEWGGKPNKENGVGDPAILVDKATGRIWICALWLHGKGNKMAWWGSEPGFTPEETGQFVVAHSDDEGETWSEPQSITPQIKKSEWFLCFNGPGMGICKEDGTLVFAAQFKDKDQVPHSTIVYSKDHGKTWHIGEGAKSKTTEAQVVELVDGTLMLNMRDDRGGARSVYTTKDMGTTWIEHPTSRKALKEPVCQASIIRIKLKDGREALAFFNPNSEKGRTHLSLKLSFDEGMTWDDKYTTLVYEPGSYGYSCLTQLDDETLGVIYEGGGDLYFQQLDLNEIIK